MSDRKPESILEQQERLYHQIMSSHCSKPTNSLPFSQGTTALPFLSESGAHIAPKSEVTKSRSLDRFIHHRKNPSLTSLLNVQNKKSVDELCRPRPRIVNQYERHVLYAQRDRNTLKYTPQPQPTSVYEHMVAGDIEIEPKIPQGKRAMPSMPFKILDAPKLRDDFYMNLLDWSPSNVLLVGLGSAVFAWNAHTSETERVMQAADMLSSVSASLIDTKAAAGSITGELLIFDINKIKCYTIFYSNGRNRIGALSWANHNVLLSGSRDTKATLYDIRAKTRIAILHGHTDQVCGVKWSEDGALFASGGGDKHLLIWDFRTNKPMFRLKKHKAAVKAISWSPHKHGYLVSGGGHADKTLRLWNTVTGKCERSVHTGGQICSLNYSKNTQEIVSTHGFSKDQILLWDANILLNTGKLTGHISRVMYQTMSPQGDTIVTGAGDKDETLRFWKLFPEKPKDDWHSQLEIKEHYLH